MHKNGGYKPGDLETVKEYKALTQKTFEAFNFAITDNDMPEELTRALQSDAFLLGALKSNAQLLEGSKMLLNEDGTVKSFAKLSEEFSRLNIQYNQNYLDSEYQFALSASQSAAKWSALDGSDRYNLQYRTAKDDRVRDSHKVLADITLPSDDPFWASFTPPNGFKCRCTYIEVLKGKYTVSDAKKAFEAGETATTEIGKGGKNRLEMFRFNPGAQKVLFPPLHPYNKVSGAKEVKTQVSNSNRVNLSELIKGESPTNAEIKAVLMKYAQLHPEDFRRGLDEVKISKATSFMMRHSMSFNSRTRDWATGSTITLSSYKFNSINFSPLEEFRGGLAAMKKGQKLTFNQEYAFESMWHEILHAKTKTKPYFLGQVGVKNMETVNQFCARHTYPGFIERLGGKASHQDEILNNGYGYRGWVADFRARLKESGIEEKTALDKLMPELLNDYPSIGEKIRELF